MSVKIYAAIMVKVTFELNILLTYDLTQEDNCSSSLYLLLICYVFKYLLNIYLLFVAWIG